MKPFWANFAAEGSHFLPVDSSRRDEGVLILEQNHCHALLAVLRTKKQNKTHTHDAGLNNSLCCALLWAMRTLTTLGAMPRALPRLFFALVEGFCSALL